MKRKTEDTIDRIVAAIIFFLIVSFFVGLSLFVRAKAPCSWLNLMPAKDVPGRCLQVKVVRGVKTSEELVQRFGAVAPVVATTPHGSYTFDIEDVVFDDIEQRYVLCLREHAQVSLGPCTECDRPRGYFAVVFRNDPQCSVLCQKAAGL